MEKQIKIIKGNWNLGIYLDLHTISSTPLLNENGEITGWDTIRTIIGEELYKLKYCDSESTLEKDKRVDILSSEVKKAIDTLIQLIKEKLNIELDISYIIPVPPSKKRGYQPVEKLAKAIAVKTGIPFNSTILKKIRTTEQLKEIEDEQEREDILKEAFDIEENVLAGKNVLLFDDLYRSGATLTAITTILKNKGKTKNVIVITITKTRTKR